MSALRIAVVVVLGVAAFAAGSWFRGRESATQTTPSRILYYQDPMHPAYRSEKPGVAPDCGMKLVPVYAESGSRTSATSGAIRIDEVKQRNERWGETIFRKVVLDLRSRTLAWKKSPRDNPNTGE